MIKIKAIEIAATSSVAISPTGNFIAMAVSATKSIQILRLPSLELFCEIKRNSNQFQFSPDGNLIVVEGQLIECITLERATTFESSISSQEVAVRLVKPLANGQVLVETDSERRELQLVDFADTRRSRTLQISWEEQLTQCWEDNGNVVLCLWVPSKHNGKLSMVDFDDGVILTKEYPGRAPWVFKDMKRAVFHSGAIGGPITVRNVWSNEEILTIPAEEGELRNFAVSDTGAYIASACCLNYREPLVPKYIQVYDSLSGSLITSLHTPDSTFTFSFSEQYIAVVRSRIKEEKIAVWEVRSGEMIDCHPTSSSFDQCIFSNDDRYLILKNQFSSKLFQLEAA